MIFKVVLKFQYSDQFLFFNQIPIIWSISTFAIEYQILIDLPFFAQISTFWSIWHFALKFQHFDQLQMLLFPNALCCSLYERNCVCAVTKIFTKFLPANNFCQLLRVTRKRSYTSAGNAQAQLHFRDDQQRAFGISNISNSHLIALKCELFDWFPTFHSKYNCLNDLVISTQISTFWLITNFVLNFNILIYSLFFQSNSNILIDSHLAIKCQHLTLCRSNFNILIDATLLYSNFNILIDFDIFTQISTFWSIPT